MAASGGKIMYLVPKKNFSAYIYIVVLVVPGLPLKLEQVLEEVEVQTRTPC